MKHVVQYSTGAGSAEIAWGACGCFVADSDDALAAVRPVAGETPPTTGGEI